MPSKRPGYSNAVRGQRSTLQTNSDLDVNVIQLQTTRQIDELRAQIIQRTNKYGATGLKEGRITTGSGDANHTLLADEYKKRMIEVSGITTPGRLIIFPQLDSAWWFFTNLSVVAVKCVMTNNLGGTGVTVGAGMTAIVRCNGSDILRGAPDVT